MNQRRRVSLTQVTSFLVASSLAVTQAGCIVSSTELINTDRVYLLGPKTESEPGPATRDVTMRAVDTRGTLAFHVDRARECTVTSTPRYQKVHVEGKKGKNIAAGIITGAILTGAAAGLIAASVVVSPEGWTTDQGGGQSEFTGGGLMGLSGIILGITGLVILPRGIYHAAVSGTTVTPGDVEYGKPPAGAVRAPEGYDPKNPDVSGTPRTWVAMGPRASQPQFGILSFGVKPAGQIDQLPTARAAVSEPLESLRSGRAFDGAIAQAEAEACDASMDPALLAIPQSSGGGVNDEMKLCVARHTPACQAKCGASKPCILDCLRKPCVENLEQEMAEAGKGDEYTEVLSRTEVCERSADSGVAIALVVKDIDGVPKTIDLGKTDRNGDVKKDLLAGLEGTYSGWPDIKQAVLQEAQVVLVEDPTVVLGKLDLAKYPGLKYAEHIVSTKKQREAMALADAARKEREAKERQAMLEAAAKAEDDALHADERKAEAAKKAQQCASQHQSRCNADCQGNQACVKKCLQKMPACK